MRKYLVDFMQECEYAEEDINALINAYETLCNCDESRKVLERIILEYESDYTLNFEPIFELFPKMAEVSGVNLYTVAFVCFLTLTRRMRKAYAERGIDDSIFLASALDLRYKLAECKRAKGVAGTFAITWYPRFFNLTRFALGRLQFEAKPIEEEYNGPSGHLPVGSTVLGVHIPNDGTPLTTESVRSSFEMAAEFYGDKFGLKPIFICRSWLLWPKHEELLKPSSNILAFMHEFEILKTGIYEGEHSLFTIFGTDETRPEYLEATTSLQRVYKELLARGEPCGWGYGIKFLK